MRKLRHREMKWLAQSHVVYKWQGQYSNHTVQTQRDPPACLRPLTSDGAVKAI